MPKRETPSTNSLEEMIGRYEKALPFESEMIVEHLREQERHCVADLIEGMHDYIKELEIKLAKAVKNRPPRKLNYKKP